jgi:hypothetical protein
VDDRASVREFQPLCQLTLNESSNFTIPFLDPRLLQPGRKSSIGRVASRVGFSQASKTSSLLGEMRVVSAVGAILEFASSITQTIEELESAVQAWQQVEHKSRIPSSSKPKDAPKEGVFGLFRKSEYTLPLHTLGCVGLT